LEVRAGRSGEVLPVAALECTGWATKASLAFMREPWLGTCDHRPARARRWMAGRSFDLGLW